MAGTGGWRCGRCMLPVRGSHRELRTELSCTVPPDTVTVHLAYRECWPRAIRDVTERLLRHLAPSAKAAVQSSGPRRSSASTPVSSDQLRLPTWTFRPPDEMVSIAQRVFDEFSDKWFIGSGRSRPLSIERESTPRPSIRFALFVRPASRVSRGCDNRATRRSQSRPHALGRCGKSLPISLYRYPEKCSARGRLPAPWRLE